MWRPDCLAAAITAIQERYAGAPREITIEANPTDCTDENLAAWRSAGIDRVSIGVQSLEPQALVTLGRDHRFGDGPSAVSRTRAAGFTTSADFILGTPGAAREIAVLDADHLSIYELTIEERTAFGKRVKDGRLVPLPDDELLELYVQTDARLAAEGYEHYEISSYARPGHRAVHNALYWQGAPYLGLGVGAASLWVAPDGSGVRQTNPRRAKDYFAGAVAERTEIDAREMAIDRAWLAMRTSDGATVSSLEPASGLVAWLISEGLAVPRGDRISPTLRGFLLADRVAAEIVESWE